jgi:hypothetical protein
MLGNAFLVEQLGFGHTSLAQVSSCTLGVMLNYVANFTVGVVSRFWVRIRADRLGDL